MKEFSVVANIGTQVAYKETVKRPLKQSKVHPTGGHGQYNSCLAEPNVSKGFEFVNDIREGRIPREFFIN